VKCLKKLRGEEVKEGKERGSKRHALVPLNV
jgi:hypothetical protein